MTPSLIGNKSNCIKQFQYNFEIFGENKSEIIFISLIIIQSFSFHSEFEWNEDYFNLL